MWEGCSRVRGYAVCIMFRSLRIYRGISGRRLRPAPMRGFEHLCRSFAAIFLSHPGYKHFYCHSVITALRYDKVGVALAWLDKIEVHRAYRFQILFDHRRDLAATLIYVPAQPPDEADVRVGVNEHFYVKQSS